MMCICYRYTHFKIDTIISSLKKNIAFLHVILNRDRLEMDIPLWQ